MCLAAYIASSAELLPQGSVIDRATFNLRPLDAAEEPVRTQFSLPFIYYLGSHTGCGCGYSPDDPANLDERRATAADLVDYLDHVAPTAAVELFVCWNGDETDMPECRLKIRRDHLVTSMDWSLERTFTWLERQLTTA